MVQLKFYSTVPKNNIVMGKFYLTENPWLYKKHSNVPEYRGWLLHW